ncbi:glycine cleavage system protein R [Pseudoalteromonas sp.]|uniref:glycine cleavage system protein R n=1 Tax=Pseudoalteromonas sp. TaxID=53249 RepID=UPI00356248A1
MKQLVLTIIGPDRSGLVDELSSAVLANHGNWLASNLSHLCGHFAGILQLEVAEEHLSELESAIHAIPDLEVKIEAGKEEVTDSNQLLNFIITSNDRPGIVQELSSVLRHKGASIVHFTSKQQSAPNWGVPLFNAEARVELPSGLSKDDVIEALESITSDLIVDIETEA